MKSDEVVYLEAGIDCVGFPIVCVTSSLSAVINIIVNVLTQKFSASCSFSNCKCSFDRSFSSGFWLFGWQLKIICTATRQSRRLVLTRSDMRVDLSGLAFKRSYRASFRISRVSCLRKGQAWSASFNYLIRSFMDASRSRLDRSTILCVCKQYVTVSQCAMMCLHSISSAVKFAKWLRWSVFHRSSCC